MRLCRRLNGRDAIAAGEYISEDYQQDESRKNQRPSLPLRRRGSAGGNRGIFRDGLSGNRRGNRVGKILRRFGFRSRMPGYVSRLKDRPGGESEVYFLSVSFLEIGNVRTDRQDDAN